jgi:hypothetical protein
MTRSDYADKVNKVERLLNDPSISLDALRIWALLSELAGAAPYDVGEVDPSVRATGAGS